ncbi:MAG: YbaK/EbsC family protein [Anaerolineales bacterium]
MKYHDLQIQTQREAPNNARRRIMFLVRAGFLTRENVLTKLGEYTINHLREVGNETLQAIPMIGNDRETFFVIPTGEIEIAHCANCKYTERIELSRVLPARRDRIASCPPLLLEKIATMIATPSNFANFLEYKKQTAKALMYTRVSDNKFVFVVVRGDMQLSEAKLKAQVGDVRAARADEIVSGAVAGYASAVGLEDVDRRGRYDSTESESGRRGE